MIDHATTSAPVFFGTHALHSEHQFTSLVLNNYRDKVVEVKSSHYDRIQPNNRPIDDPLIQLEAKGTLPITHVSKGSPMIRHLINNHGTRNVTTYSFRRIVVRSEKQYHSEIPLTDKYPNQQHPPADWGA